jgi:hypothetical protein
MTLSQQVIDLIDDANNFLFYANDAERQCDEKQKLMYSRAVIVTSYSAFEGWINYISSSYAAHDNTIVISQFEKSFLLEKKIEVNNNGEIQITNQDKYENTCKKLQFILKRFGNYDLKKSDPCLWADLKKIERIRNLLVHPKKSTDKKIDLDDAKFCLKTITKVIEILKEKI